MNTACHCRGVDAAGEELPRWQKQNAQTAKLALKLKLRTFSDNAQPCTTRKNSE